MVKLEFIKDDSARRVTYRKISKGALKKVDELSTLCDVGACVVVYGPYSETPGVWPSIDGAKEVLKMFRGMPEHQQSVKMESQESFTKEMIKKVEEKLAKMQLENCQEDLTRLMYKGKRGEKINNLSVEELWGIVAVTKEKIEEMKMEIERHKKGIVSEGAELENTKGKEKVVGEDTPDEKLAQVEETLSVINDTSSVQQYVGENEQMDQEKLQRILAIAMRKSVVNDFPRGRNSNDGVAIRERGNVSVVNIALTMLNNPAPAYHRVPSNQVLSYQGTIHDLVLYPNQGFGWEDNLNPFIHNLDWSSLWNPSNNQL